jgi:ketosteroid isomerase-like protein
VAAAIEGYWGMTGLATDAHRILLFGLRKRTTPETWLSLWDAEGIQMPPGMPARGKDVLDAGIPKAFSAIPAKAVNINPEEIVVAGDWAYSRGSYNADQVVQGKDVHIDGKFLTIFRRQDDGSWRIYRDIFNFNDR